MLDSETKRRLDRLRDILVGKLPDPKSQVEQITFGLIYKFMHDMDMESIDAGGKATFFSGKFKKYSWKELFDSRRGGVERVKLYSEAIEQMYTHEKAPELFREIFKNSFLPFKDPSTLNMFLKEIDEFHYSHSEKLGDAYEYLLSFMGSQGDAGQFRTPRHIIDFIVEIVDPKKNERILDPACGTAGFLISSYKHIMNKSKSPKGKKLTALERKKLSNNLVGYDISPDMTRISLVNMYLHNFTNPQIHEYDTLSSEDKWNEFYDVILANPPFFSPKGGIQPHSRFGVDSKRAEVLFVDYIIQHLSQNGRAGIIVPEGIIFQTGRAYKALRKKLVEDCLVGVISLPAGVFQPYSGVKTSVLILDREFSLSSDEIFFAKVESDGYSLSSQRHRISDNDLPSIISEFDRFTSNPNGESVGISKNSIASTNDYTLSAGKYVQRNDIHSKFPISKIKNVCDIETGKKDVNSGNSNGEYPFFTCAREHTYSDYYSFDTEALLIAGNGEVGRVTYYKGKFEAYQRTYVLSNFKNIEPKFLFFILQSRLPSYLDKLKQGNTMPYVKVGMLKDFQIPLPPTEIQQEIVHVLDGYQKIIDGARQVVENLRPSIDIREEFSEKEISKFKKVCITNVAKFYRGVTYKKSQEVNQDGIAILRANNVSLGGKLVLKDVKNVSKNVSIREDQWLKSEDILMCIASGSKEHIGKTTMIMNDLGMAFGGFMGVLRSNDRVLPKFLFGILQHKAFNDYLSEAISGANINNIKEGILSGFKFELPTIKSQSQLVKQLLNEQETIDKNIKLIESYTKKIQDRIAKVWGE